MAKHSIIGSCVVIVLLIAAPLAVGGEVQLNEVATGAPLPHWQPSSLRTARSTNESVRCRRKQPRSQCQKTGTARLKPIIYRVDYLRRRISKINPPIPNKIMVDGSGMKVNDKLSNNAELRVLPGPPLLS